MEYQGQREIFEGHPGPEKWDEPLSGKWPKQDGGIKMGAVEK
jgi:hypothetical protein